MKKIISIVLILCLSVGLFSGCSQGGMKASKKDIAALEALYEGRTAAYGDPHCHSASSINSDGKHTIAEFKQYMDVKQIDFIAVVDHGQTTHMTLDSWDDTFLVGGSEPGATITDVEVESRRNMDYAMIFTDVKAMETVLEAYPDEFAYDKETGFFKKNFAGEKAKLQEIIQCVKDNGGMWVYVHPFCKSEPYGYDPVDFKERWFADETGFEICNSDMGNFNAPENYAAYECWVELLNAGKRIWATSGSDSHSGLPWEWNLVTLYADEKNGEGYFRQMKVGNLTAGPVGIRMAVGDATTGSTGSFAGNRVVIAAGDFHSWAVEEDHIYRLDIYDETGLVSSQELSTTEMNYFAFKAREDAKYYRANVYDVTGDKLFAVGNPVWNG